MTLNKVLGPLRRFKKNAFTYPAIGPDDGKGVDVGVAVGWGVSVCVGETEVAVGDFFAAWVLAMAVWISPSDGVGGVVGVQAAIREMTTRDKTKLYSFILISSHFLVLPIGRLYLVYT
jgi:hypothetical protein